MAKRIAFVGGGGRRRSPVVAVPVGAQRRWSDDVGVAWAQAAKDARGVALLSLDRSTPALVLGPLETCTTCVPDAHGVVLARWLDARGFDHGSVPRAAAAVERAQWGWTNHVLHIDKPTTFALFAAAVREGPYGEARPFGPLGEENHPFGFTTFALTRAGHYGVEVTQPFTMHGVTLDLVRLRHSEATDHATGPATAKRAAPAKARARRPTAAKTAATAKRAATAKKAAQAKKQTKAKATKTKATKKKATKKKPKKQKS